MICLRLTLTFIFIRCLTDVFPFNFQGLLPTPPTAPISQVNGNHGKGNFTSNTNGYNKSLSNSVNTRTNNFGNQTKYTSQNSDYHKHSDVSNRTLDKQFAWQRMDRKDTKESHYSNQDTQGHIQSNGYSFQKQKYSKGRVLQSQNNYYKEYS